jgi:LysR family hydrogen peroxide-inducible transcriptional activator
MDLTALTLTELRYLVAVAETGHFGRAATRCHVSQPTLSAQIKKLEATLGVLLFERDTRRVRPTAAGERVAERARIILDEVRAIGDVARGHADPLAGALRLGVIPTLGPSVLPWLVPRLRTAFPGLELIVREGLTATLLDDLAMHQLDAALVALPTTAPGLVDEPLFDEPFWLLTPPGHPLAHRTRLREADLAAHRVLLLTEGHCLRDQALALPHRRGDDVVARPFTAPAPARRIGLVTRRSFPRRDAVQALAAFIRADLQQGARRADGGRGPRRAALDPVRR